MILGVDWLKCHNPLLFDFEASVITITRQQKPVLLHGIGEGALQSRLWYSVDVLQRKGVDLQTLTFCILAM